MSDVGNVGISKTEKHNIFLNYRTITLKNYTYMAKSK